MTQRRFLMSLPWLILLVPGILSAQPGSPGRPAATWNDHPGKGRVRQSFADAVASGKSGQDRTGLTEQQYTVSSPDGSRQLIYTYDHSQPVLVVNGQLRGKSGGAQSFQLPVDDGFTSHGLFPDNAGEVFAIQTDADDGLYLIRYQPGTEASQVLQVGPSGSRRNRFVPHFGAAGKVYVANVTESRAGVLTGVMVSAFDFGANRVEEVQFHPVSAELRAKMSTRLPEGRYDLVRFHVDAQGERTIELEKHDIAANTYRYDPFAVHDPAGWQPRKQQVRIGERLVFRLNAEGKILSETVVDQFKTDVVH
ncbi:MAG: hypothetical protein AVDCRST_MAG56-6470 [uncultured Cytophagales bacterium]|uniref:Uncharacterized protein n=1 Tax=uncultured Cytophagales bacterium TaxID=158755 RepID=A0A6J4KIG9_9SPHI|nr:MAG: hypothetical protein AVDCRST_MAG56-6470 [uncultured Cytophagales bacterium]